MKDSIKIPLFTLLKTCASALIVFVTALLSSQIGSDSNVAMAVGGSIATAIQLV